MTLRNTTISLFYGPGGAGKTLSVFKYATLPENKDKRKLLVSNDTFHIGARGRFESFCDLIGSESRILKTEAVIELQDSIEQYDELYFDLMFKSEKSVLKIISSFPGCLTIKKVLVLNMLMLLDENLSTRYCGNAGQSDEYIITFLDQLPLLSCDNQERIRIRLHELADKFPLWISDGQDVTKNFHPYKEPL